MDRLEDISSKVRGSTIVPFHSYRIELHILGRVVLAVAIVIMHRSIYIRLVHLYPLLRLCLYRHQMGVLGQFGRRMRFELFAKGGEVA